ncbi:Endonuclease/Exonuclease/phosphatase family protein [Marinilabilia salmonicolor]|jgi:predicted extracellular nuclease|uniref:endonuclease/exonuclease/phosphatase family protein n=1 Tax=Marinilabilia salmonicolor TaxID=989 RepID=UPI000D0764EB|nr:endonuclease/exonuclease/phosphatase family protein [Marinilabilia salmonicolor]PRZ00912.1 Endonuclease/Exonuclease/phosphatase family protein [Marinilabilia salmonicolor]
MNNLMKGLLLLLVTIVFLSCQLDENKRVVGFYNLENLFDTIDAPDVRDEEFTPGSEKQWDANRYERKLQNMAAVISGIGAAEGVDAPAVMGLCEMENRGVLEDLVVTDRLKAFNYEIIHKDSPDNRGIDVALIFRPDFFKPESYRAVPLFIEDEEGERLFTRDQLVVTGTFDGDRLHFIVNHWPSRYGGKERSIPLRNAAAELTRSLVDSIKGLDADARVIIMGDLNDDPVDVSVKKYLRAGVTSQDVKSDSLFNATAPLFFQGRGTLCYRDFWNLFDQIIVTPNLMDANSGKHHIVKTEIYDKQYLRQQEGDYSGYPFRTFVGDWYHGGYSDHFSSYVVLKQK